MLDAYNELNKALEVHDELVLAIMVDHRGSAPQIDGAKAIISKTGLVYGTVGGGKIEQRVILESIELLSSTVATKFLKWNLQKDIGMTCGGEVSFYIEKYGSAKLDVAIFGAGHVSQALVPLLLKLNCRIKCIDSRPEWLEKLPNSEKLEKVCLETPFEYVSSLKKGSFLISMTQGHSFDLPILEKALKRREDFPYIGVIGSNQKAQVIKADLVSRGFSQCDLEHLICPIGLKFGSNVPEEIAFSIIAQILSKRDSLS